MIWEQFKNYYRFDGSMWKFFLIIFLSAASLGSGAQDVEGILQKHYKAYQQDFWDQIQTANVRGIWLKGSDKTNFELLAKKPGKIIIRGRWQSEPYAASFDGASGWTIAPWTGVKVAQLMLPKEQRMMQAIFDFGSPIPREAAMEYRGEMEVYGIPCYRVATKIGAVEYEYFIDQEDYYLRRLDRRELAGEDTHVLTKSFDQYRKFSGIVIPTLIVIQTEDLEKEYVFDDVVVGNGISNLIFRRPE